MGKYGKAAILAFQQLQHTSSIDPHDAWNRAVAQVFPDSPSSQAKGCPKGAFLGLCSEGLIKGVEPGRYTRSKDNRRYATESVRILSFNPTLVEDPAALWRALMRGDEKVENSQIDVVISLWKERAIVTSNVKI